VAERGFASRAAAALLALGAWLVPACRVAASDGIAAPLAARLAERDAALAERGLDRPAPPAAAIAPYGDAGGGGALSLHLSGVRLALTRLSLGGGADGLAALRAAQPDDGPGALYIRSGTADLATLYDRTRDGPMEDALVRDTGGHVARVPIVVMRGAGLRLSDGDRLGLDGPRGAFLLSFGRLVIDGAEVTALGPPQDSDSPSGGKGGFRPFVASAGSGALRVTDSRLTGLGFGTAPVTAGLSLRVGGLFRPESPGHVSGTTLEDVRGLHVTGDRGTTIHANRFVAPRGTAIHLEEADDARVTSNLVEDGRGAYALRLAGPARGAAIEGNALVDGAHAGMRIDDGAQGARLSGNLVSGFPGRAVEIGQGAGCLRLSGNAILDNRGDAIAAAEAGTLVIDGNALVGNGGAAVSLSRLTEGSRALVISNAVSGNRTGLRTAGVPRLRLAGTTFDGQRPRLLSGDAGQHTPRLLRAMKRGAPDLALEHVAARTPRPLPDDAAARAFAACRTEGGA